MGICCYCYWGWPKAVAEIYQKALADLDGCESLLHGGPAHIVWADENFHSAEWCIEHFDGHWGDYSVFELAIVLESLKKLAAFPDDEHPELFPPPTGVEWS